MEGFKMGHIAYEATFQRKFGKTLVLSVMKSSDQFRVALHFCKNVVQPPNGLINEGKPLVNFYVTWNKYAKPFWKRIGQKYATKPSWVAKVQFGRGAGYIGGATAFFGWNCKGGRVWGNSAWSQLRLHVSRFHGDSFRIGFTRNGNATPYPKG